MNITPSRDLKIDYFTLLDYQIKYIFNTEISVFTDSLRIFLRNANIILGCFWATYHIKNNMLKPNDKTNIIDIVNLYKLLSYLVPVVLGIIIGHTTATFYEKIGNSYIITYFTSLIIILWHGIIELTTIALVSYILFYKVFKELFVHDLTENTVLNKINESINCLYNHLAIIILLFMLAAYIEAKSGCGSLYYLFLLNSK